MDMQLNSIPAEFICEGCLSVDRKLTPVLDEDTRRVFCDVLDPLDHIHHPLSLCWECRAMIRRVIQFRRKIQRAHDCLVRFMLHQTTELTTLSTLSKSITIQELSFSHDKETVKDEHITNHDNTVESDENIAKCPKNRDILESRPLFIKMEDDDAFQDLDGFYVDESNEKTGNNEEDVKTDLKLDRSQYNSTDVRTTAENFNDSDDEPLTLKKTKKKQNGPKVDGRKYKKEKPPGVVRSARVNKKLQELNVPADQLEMVVLDWDEVEAERQKALASSSFTRHDYRCYDCVTGFNHRSKLENHMLKHQPSAGEIVCEVCRVRFRHKHALCAHRRRHRVRWRCCSCGATWSRAAVAADHYARAHAHGGPAPTHTCPTCGHTEPTLGKLRNHLKNHAERQKCELCGKTFRDRSSLRTHLFIHKGEKEYACPRCGKKFLFKKAMEVHLVTHDVSEQLYCHQCDMNFKNRMSYYQHMKYNLKHIDPAKLKYACKLCDKKFAKAVRLEEHNIAVHLKVTPIRCVMAGCNFACSSRPVLRTHVRMVHRNLRAARNHVCDTCGKAYTTKKTLEGHIRSHTGERPFRCQLCPSTFGYEAALYNHNKLVHLRAKKGRNGPAEPALLPALPHSDRAS